MRLAVAAGVFVKIMTSRPPAAMRFFIRGRVQGVGFRFFVQALAAQLDVRGWVRNRADGSVEAFAIAPPPVLAHFADALRQGPSAARVENVESRRDELPPLDRYPGFSVEGDA